MRILTSESMSKCDKRTMSYQKVDEIYLVKKAAQAIFEKIKDKLNLKAKIIIVCGNSNNSSDGFCLCDLLNKKGYDASVLYLFDKAFMKATCNYFYNEKYVYRDLNCLAKADVIIDCIIGNGLKGSLRQEVAKLIEKINDIDAYKIAIDLPTGLNADTGNYDPICFKALLTIAINNLKLGHLLNDGPDVCGEIRIADIGLNDYEDLEHVDAIKVAYKQKRLKNSNKYDYGNILVIGSNENMSGAGIMASMAALKAGCGLVTIAVPVKNYDIVAIKAPYEIMVRKLEALDDLLIKKDIVIFGPGLGRSEDYTDLLKELIQKDINLIVDADGLYHLSKIKDILMLKKCHLCITPHFGEAATLLNKKSKDIKADPFFAFKELINKYDAIVVLKGHYSLVGYHKQYYFSLYGNSGMATAGSGDVLSGIIAGTSRKKINLDNVYKAVCIHGLAGDIAKEKYGQDSLIASDIYNAIGAALKE